MKKLKNYILNTFYKNNIIRNILVSLNSAKAKVFLVGGAVRDLFLKDNILKDNKDLDIEIHNLNLKELSEILKKFGTVDYIGKSFGVLKLHNLNVDWSLPRTDSSGRKPQVSIDPYLDIKQALKRRDLTINAIAINLLNFELIDPFNGLQDIENKILRSPDINFFKEDPLRFYRVMQFISRFQMYPDKELNNLCKSMDISKVSKERIEQEFIKLLLKSSIPSLGLRWLKDIGRLKEILPELYDTIDIEQDPKWHPEGSVFEHLMQSLDCSANLKYKDQNEKLVVMLAALTHDLGKVKTTIFKDGHIRSPGHATVGSVLAKNMLNRITDNKRLINTVSVLVKAHMRPGQLINSDAKIAAYKRLALDLDSQSLKNANINMLLKLAISDQLARNPDSHKPLSYKIRWIEEFKNKVKEAQILDNPEKEIIKGRDILDLVKPGPEMGKILKFAYQLQLSKNIKDKNLLKKLIISHFNIKS